ncbi:hypothetical protein [Candidatus Igneacidithiobacillus taiwanensis]|uniref:type II toxin-antitoxin system Phd/YefM family antitoxin n=1 Tax=Candidatus Igneacidithiobacillus taiwanensis TaxID=1945924 RepID=UPI0028A20938|nr:hypothetical protein [Candidatus Igneacidithiobacillus taiwanensis]
MDEIKVGIREFRARLPHFLLDAGRPVAITRHGETIGYFIPYREKRCPEDSGKLLAAGEQMERFLAGKGISEDDILEEFRHLRSKDHT